MEWLENKFTPPPQCMPDEYKHEDYITAYKQYYIGEKKDSQSILELTHQTLCVNVIHHEKIISKINVWSLYYRTEIVWFIIGFIVGVIIL